MVHLLNTYQTGVATWMDIFDHDCSYQREVLRRCTTSELLIRSVCAFTAKNLSLHPSGDVWAAAAARYYGESLRILIDYLDRDRPHEDALTAAMLLCSYEMIASQGLEHRRHLYGAMILIVHRGVDASSVGLDRANFWIYIRHEITVALFHKTALQISPEKWHVDWKQGQVGEDSMGNQLLWLLGRAIQVAYGRDVSITMTWSDERRDIHAEAARWFDGRSLAFRGVKYGEPNDQGFSKLYFAIPSAG
ncbi:hypothetical protein QQX98_007652 [Neonectria punicea]|uniref:Uncharacterized protein n=1 Tax=Neonectria punicea TaxID=979145 RepID=A0ABR1GXE4_9HYPO